MVEEVLVERGEWFVKVEISGEQLDSLPVTYFLDFFFLAATFLAGAFFDSFLSFSA